MDDMSHNSAKRRATIARSADYAVLDFMQKGLHKVCRDDTFSCSSDREYCMSKSLGIDPKTFCGEDPI